jgi:hypothetical protein
MKPAPAAAATSRSDIGIGRLQHRRQVRVDRLDLADERGAGRIVQLAGPREAAVGDHAQQRAVVAVEPAPGLLEARGQQDLRPRAHAQQAVAEVDALVHQVLRLAHDLGVEQAADRASRNARNPR